MKKLLLLVAVLLCWDVLAASAADDRAGILKVYNWADYIDEDVLAEFPAWYKEQTGEDVKVIYQLFDINEVMLSKIERGKEDYDVVCPSDYIIERMLRNDLLLPIDKDFGATPDYIDSCVSPYIVSRFGMVDGSGKNVNDYAVGYMWGTTGMLYNTRYVTREEASSWQVLSNPKFAGKLFMKDAFRDVYAPLLIFLKQDEIRAGKVTPEELMYDTSEESVALVENYLKSIKDYVSGWEADFGKEQMTKEKGYLNLTWSGDASWAIEEAASVDVPLDYVVPMEGSNVWFDGWVIPKYARNVKAARYFINYLCQPEVAVRNMDAIGYVSAIASPELLASMQDSTMYGPINASYFFGAGADSVFLNPVQYPDSSVIARCVMMHDTGDRTEVLLAMWSRVKGDNASAFTLLVILAAVATLAWMGLSRRKKQHRRRR